MRKIITLSAMLLMCVLSFAQQALWGGAAVISPEIHENNTVSFRLKAPKAVRVQVTGDFLPTQKIKTPYGEFDGPVRPTLPRKTAYGNLPPRNPSSPNCTATPSW